MRAAVTPLLMASGLLFFGCATQAPDNKAQVLSGPQASVVLRLPEGTLPFTQMRKFPKYADFSTGTQNLGKSLGLTVVISEQKVDISRGVDAVIGETLAQMRETYTNPQVRSVGSANVLGKAVPMFETKDGTGDNYLSASIPLRRGSITITLTAAGEDDVLPHTEFFKALLEGASIREK